MRATRSSSATNKLRASCVFTPLFPDQASIAHRCVPSPNHTPRNRGRKACFLRGRESNAPRVSSVPPDMYCPPVGLTGPPPESAAMSGQGCGYLHEVLPGILPCVISRVASVPLPNRHDQVVGAGPERLPRGPKGPRSVHGG